MFVSSIKKAFWGGAYKRFSACVLLQKLLTALSALLFAGSLAYGQQLEADNLTNSIRVKLAPGIGLRDLSQKHLGDPDLWPVILRANGFSKIIDLADDQELLIPASEVRLAALALESSLKEIQKANESGAQVFAPKLISSALEFRDEALGHNRDGAYKRSISFSSKSITSAENALDKSQSSRDVAAEARLSDRQGWVEGQKPAENSWIDRPLNSILTEEEKIRTLSKSTAQIVFRDASRLRLNANSQAIIQRIRVDPLKRKQEAQISLVKGDFYAVLASEGSRNLFEVNIPDINATIDSGNFWVSHNENGSKFTNYDVKPVSITARGETLTLGRNEGAFVQKGAAPGQKIAVKGRVTLSLPEDDTIVYQNPMILTWENVDGAGGYWVEIAFDASFDRMRDSLWGLEKNQADNISLAPGIYYWRVVALDEAGLPGQRSTTRKFEVRTDAEPPFLQLRTPEPGEIFRKAAVTISGEVEKRSAVLINGVPAETDSDGRFSLVFQSLEGLNKAEIIARDVAGNETRKEISFLFLKDDRSDVTYNSSVPRDKNGVFLTAGNTLSLSGVTEKKANVAVLDPTGAQRSVTFTDEFGSFALNIPLTQLREELELRVTTQSGFSYTEKIQIRQSTQPPAFALTRPLPRITDLATLEFTAKVDAGSKVTMNGQRAEVENSTALFSVKLIKGANLLEFITTSPVGLVTVEKWTVIFDQQAPTVVSKSVKSQVKGENTFYSMRLKAKDASGLSKTARFTIRSGGREFEGVLRFNRARKRYSGGIEIPTEQGAAKPVIVVELEDVAGNKTKVKMTQ